MNTDFRLSLGFFDHPKIKKIDKKIGDAGVLCVIKLFKFTAQNKPDGALSHMDDDDIEIAADWKGEAGVFVRALIDARILDGRFGSHAVHDWADHNPWAAGATVRIEKARKGANTRWGNLGTENQVQNDAPSIIEQCSEIGQAHLSNAPILSDSFPTPFLTFPTPKDSPHNPPRGDDPLPSKPANKRVAKHHPAVTIFHEARIVKKGRAPSSVEAEEKRAIKLYDENGDAVYRKAVTGYFSSMNGTDIWPEKQGFTFIAFLRQFDKWADGSNIQPIMQNGNGYHANGLTEHVVKRTEYLSFAQKEEMKQAGKQ